MELATRPLTLRLREPLETSYGELSQRELLLVRLTDADGAVGYGEAAPLEPYDGVSLGEVQAALDAYRDVAAGFESIAPGERLAACRARADLPQALAAIDLALWDLRGRREDRSLATLLARRPAVRVPVNATIGALDRAGAAEHAIAASRAGFRCVKLKVGVGDDAGRVAAVRAAIGPEAELRLDANGAWTVAEAVAAIGALAPAGLELVEEPVHGLDGLRSVRERVPVRIAMDETATAPGAIEAGAADAVCLKIARGGISGVLADAATVRTTGAEVYLASSFDGPLGVAAAVHVAAALAPLPACGLATLSAFAELDDPLPPREGAIDVPSSPGLGVTPPWPGD